MFSLFKYNMCVTFPTGFFHKSWFNGTCDDVMINYNAYINMFSLFKYKTSSISDMCFKFINSFIVHLRYCFINVYLMDLLALVMMSWLIIRLTLTRFLVLITTHIFYIKHAWYFHKCVLNAFNGVVIYCNVYLLCFHKNYWFIYEKKEII